MVAKMNSHAQVDRPFSGQWFLAFEGQQSGNGLLSFNEFGDHSGYLSVYQVENPHEKTPALQLQGRMHVEKFHGTKFSGIADALNTSSPGQVRLLGKLKEDSAIPIWTGTWSSTDKYEGTFEMLKLLPRRLEQNNVKLVSNWNEVTEWAFSKEADTAVFRGLGDRRYSLESTAHRAGIYDLHHYLVQMLPRVRAELLKRHGLRIDLSAPDELAEILALIRHHGFPSPIMDWSKSPWVALYFASTTASNLLKQASKPDYFRVYCMRHKGISVVADVKQALLAPSINGQLIEIPTPMTSRVTAQEGVFLLTPCVDVVSPLNHLEKKGETVILDAIDVSVSMLGELQHRLDQMMINEATMMSSIDSTMSYLARRLIV